MAAPASLTTRAAQLIELEQQCGANNYAPLPVVLERGAGAWVTDVEGRRYLDMLSAYSATSFGHAHPDLVRRAVGQLQRLTLTGRAFFNDQLPLFCSELAELCAMDVVLPMNTGAEAVETALKAARRWGYEVKGVARDRARIIAFENNFHGRTITAVSMSTSESAFSGYGPLTPGFDIVPFGDLEAVSRTICADTVGVLVEPIQGEGGVIVPPDGFLRGLRELCDEHGVLLMCDEIQTGLGRTGRLFAIDHDRITADLLILGKALGGGLVPVSAVVGTREVMRVFTPGTHGSTFGGNPLAAAIGRAAIGLLRRGDLVTQGARLGAYLREQLEALDHPAVIDVRGRGLLLAIELHGEAPPAREVAKALMRLGVLCKETKNTVLRFAPPLVVTRAALDFGLKQIRTAIDEVCS